MAPAKVPVAKLVDLLLAGPHAMVEVLSISFECILCGNMDEIIDEEVDAGYNLY